MRRALFLLFIPTIALLGFFAPPGWPCVGCDAHLQLRAGSVWRAAAIPEFGGISGLEIGDAGQSVTVVSDRARLFSARLRRDPQTHRLLGVGPVTMAELRNGIGQRLTPFNSDAESLATTPQGDLFVGFEGLARIVSYPAAGNRTAQRLHAWDHFRDLWGNAGFEALTPLPDGGLLALSEAGQAYILRDKLVQQGFKVSAQDGFSVSGADLGPQGDLWLLERRLGWTGFTTRITRITLVADKPVKTLVLLQGHIGWRDNYEGISLRCDAAGQTVVTLVSDDGFSIWQRTALVEFVLRPDPAQPVCSSN